MSESTPKVSVRRVDETLQYNQGLIQGLQLVCMPSDEIYPIAGSMWWVAWSGHCLAGFGGLKRLEHEPSVGFLCRAGVLDTYRGKGLHRRIIRVRVSAAKRLSLDYVTTYTLSLNAASSNNLIREGFKTYSPPWLWAGKGVVYWIRDLR